MDNCSCQDCVNGKLIARLSDALAASKDERKEAMGLIKEYLTWLETPPVVYYRPHDLVERMKIAVSKEAA